MRDWHKADLFLPPAVNPLVHSGRGCVDGSAEGRHFAHQAWVGTPPMTHCEQRRGEPILSRTPWDSVRQLPVHMQAVGVGAINERDERSSDS